MKWKIVSFFMLSGIFLAIITIIISVISMALNMIGFNIGQAFITQMIGVCIISAIIGFISFIILFIMKVTQ